MEVVLIESAWTVGLGVGAEPLGGVGVAVAVAAVVIVGLAVEVGVGVLVRVGGSSSPALAVAGSTLVASAMGAMKMMTRKHAGPGPSLICGKIAFSGASRYPSPSPGGTG
jgi:hypothetical protein